VYAAEPGFRLAPACVQGARRRCKPTQKQRLVYVSEQWLLWCPLRCEIPLFNILLGIPLTIIKACSSKVLLLYSRYSSIREGLLLVLFKLKLVVVRIKEYSFNISWIRVSLLVVLPEFLLPYI
jgi:hypothetical protein